MEVRFLNAHSTLPDDTVENPYMRYFNLDSALLSNIENQTRSDEQIPRVYTGLRLGHFVLKEYNKCYSF